MHAVSPSPIHPPCLPNQASNITPLFSVIYIGYILLSAYSLYPTKDARLAHSTKVAEKKAEKERWESIPYAKEITPEEQWQHMWELQQLPRTPGTAASMHAPWRGVPATPRTRAFNELQGGTDVVEYDVHAGKGKGAVEYDASEYAYDRKGKGTAV